MNDEKENVFIVTIVNFWNFFLPCSKSKRKNILGHLWKMQKPSEIEHTSF